MTQKYFLFRFKFNREVDSGYGKKQTIVVRETFYNFENIAKISINLLNSL